MKTIRIENYPNFYMVEDEKISKYLSDGVLDLDSKKFKTANKTPIKDFAIQIRVTKLIDKKQKSKKKLMKFNGVTILQALKNMADLPEDLLSQMKSESDTKQIEAEKKAKQIETEQAEKSNRILNDVWDEFYKSKTSGARTDKWRDSTAKTYKSFYNVWMRDTDLGSTPMQDITKNDCIALIDDVAELRTLRTATTVIEVLRPLFDWYFEENDIDKRNPVPSKKNYKLSGEHDNKRVVDVPLSQIKKLYEVIDNYDSDLFRNVFMWIRTGRRRGEVITLQMGNINVTKKHFTIEARNNKAKVKMQYRLRPELEATLIEVTNPKDYLFESDRNKGEHIHVDSITKHWNKIKEKVGGVFELNQKEVDFTTLHLHDIRHIINGVLKRAEVPQEIREKVLGHKNTSINERYGVGYYDDIDKSYQLFLDIVYGVVPEDTKWGAV